MLPSLRRELISMANAIPHMSYVASRGFAKFVCATDAMGSSHLDNAGHGGAVSNLSEEELELLLHVGEHPGRTISRVSGELSGCRNPYKSLLPSRPFSRLPNSMFEANRWLPFMQGRWQHADHINLGET